MAIPLPYVGEVVIASMVKAMRRDFLELCGLSTRYDPDFVTSQSTAIAYTDVALFPYSGKAFDGASRIDLVVLLNESYGVPFEIKLGTTRLSKTRIDEEWLTGCGLSHQGNRMTGNMMSILERRFHESVPAGSLVANIDGRSVALTEDWFVIARAKVIDSWVGRRRPSFSPMVHLCRFEDIVEQFGGREPFNALVKDLFDFDYYAAWVSSDT